jgi:phosphocarrier protein HPr
MQGDGPERHRPETSTEVVARRRVEIVNRKGLHARASAKLQKIACGFSSRLIVHHQGEAANARSIMDLLMLGAGKGSEIELEAVGEDADACVTAASSLIANGFDEED